METMTSQIAPKPKAFIDLNVPYYAQLDSVTGQGFKMCFSSSCAMIAEFLKPGCLTGRGGQPDDAYLGIVERFGDTTGSVAQTKALNTLGFKVAMRFNGNISDLVARLRAGSPIAVGWLHHGPMTAPVGGGHWSVVKGWDEAKGQFIFHDPNGEADLVRGGYVTTSLGSGKNQRYSEKNWGRRWMVGEGARFQPGTGWWLDIRK
jgi:hypothetical protein